MPQVIPFFLASMAVTAAILITALLVILHYLRQVRSFEEQVQNLPNAVRLPGLKLEVERADRELVALKESLTSAHAIIARRQEAEQWLATHGSTYFEAQDQLPVITAKVEALKRKISDLEQERERLMEMQKDSANMQMLVAKKVDAEKWLAANGASCDEARRQLPSLLQERDVIRREIELFKQEREELQVEISEGKSQRNWLREDDRRLSELVDVQSRELEKSRTEFEAIQAREAGLHANLEELSARLQQRQQELRDVQADLPGAKKQLEDARERLNAVVAEHERRKREIEEFKIEHQNLIKLLEAAEKRWTQLAPAAGGNEELRLAELWEPVLKIGYFASSQDGEEADCLNATTAYLERLGLHFPQRVMRAFHTSLKVSEVSPLVVLAGISGTGKSELPRRYAEGMGIYFLNIPVQPRWDSPQDMFGFYNYMENRYRATELARALVQMDPFANEAGRGWNVPPGWEKQSLADHMLLVLLDEMNLARVEFYFSEFLSRLETRRGINPEDPFQRRNAEISLEVGLRSLMKNAQSNGDGHHAAMQVFVDRNVLFVGTMNEDETTQTLSDKVVDRANVIRFGKPSGFGRREATKSVSPPTTGLSRKTWESWLRSAESLPQPVNDAVNSWIGQLNDAMQAIRRPFAHRTYLAIRTYVANYPDPNAFKEAMADQIELKILPKFRGVDPEEGAAREAIQKVRGVLEDLEDQQLVSALDECLQHGEHQFMWQGIDRSADVEL